MQYSEPLNGMFTHSKLLILDFANIPDDVAPTENMRLYFERARAARKNPRSPEMRQLFNNRMLQSSGSKYLVSQYGEDRSAMLEGSSIAAEGRVLHLGIDIFCRDLETVYAPCSGRIVRAGRENEAHSFGNFCILQPEGESFYIFFGHLAQDLPKPGAVNVGQPIARLGDYQENENGGWSRHLHLQLLARLPEEGVAPLGYSSVGDFTTNSRKYPDPMTLFPGWNISS